MLEYFLSSDQHSQSTRANWRNRDWNITQKADYGIRDVLLLCARVNQPDKLLFCSGSWLHSQT